MALQFPSLDAAIGKAEGFGVAGAIPTVNNNPGDIIGGAFATSQGATGTDSHGFAIFPDAATGYAALDANLSAYQAANPNITLSGVASQWAPASGTGNNAATPSTWLSNVTAGLGGGQNGNTPLSSLAASTTNLASSTATAATFGLYNPAGSGVNIELIDYDMALTGATAVVGTLELAVLTQVGQGLIALPTSITQLTPLANPIGSTGAGTPQGICFSAATVVASTKLISLGYSFGTTTESAGPVPCHVEFDGKVILAPGTLIHVTGSAAQTTAALQQLRWAEFPV